MHFYPVNCAGMERSEAPRVQPSIKLSMAPPCCCLSDARGLRFAETKPSNSVYLLCKSRIVLVFLTLAYQILNFGWKETF